MHRVNIFQFYRFGYAIRSLEDISKDNLLFDKYPVLSDAHDALIDMLSQEQIKLTSIRPAVEELVGQIEEIIAPIDRNTEDVTAETKIKASQAAYLKKSFRKFETIFEAEDRRVNVYSVGTKGIYDTSLLVENADHIILDDVRQGLPDAAKYDLQQAGRCLAFEVPTASGFHVLRATETVIKLYYKELTGNEWDAVNPESRRNWGQYTEGIKTAGAKQTIVDSLNQIRSTYRNPIVHPESVLDIHEATNLFNVCSSVMTIMLREVLQLRRR